MAVRRRGGFGRVARAAYRISVGAADAVRWVAVRVLLCLLLLGLVGLNVASLTVSGVQAALSGLLEAVDTPTIRAGQAKALADMRADRDKARGEADRLKRQLARAEKTTRSARSAARTAGADRSRLARELAKSRQDHRRIAAEFARQRKLFSAVSRTLMRRAVEGVARKLGSLAGKAVPFAGIAVLVAATAWEIDDACASAREIADMNRKLGLDGDPEGHAATICGQPVPTVGGLAEQVFGWEPSPEVLHARCVDGLSTSEEDPKAWQDCAPLLPAAAPGEPPAAGPPGADPAAADGASGPQAPVEPRQDQSYSDCVGALGSEHGAAEEDPLGWERCARLLPPQTAR